MAIEHLQTNLGLVQYNDQPTNLTWSSSYGGGLKTDADFEAQIRRFQSAQNVYKEPTIKIEEKKKMATTKRALYQVILVDPKAGKIIFNELVISSKPEDVLLEVDAGKVIKDNKLEVGEVDKIINLIGEIRRTKKNKDGIVEIATDEKE